MADEFHNNPPIFDKVNSMLVNNPQPQAQGVFTEADRKTIQETRDGVVRLLEWKEGHKELHEKNDERNETRLNEHARKISSLRSDFDKWSGFVKTAGIITLVSTILAAAIILAIKYIP